jgi:hypothetical protein
MERREAATKDLLSNLPRTDEHPTLRTLIEIAEIYSLTLEGAHRLFGYDLRELRKWDLYLNGDRTHIFESYPFERDMLIDLPSRFAPPQSFTTNAFLRNLVLEWQTDVPLRTLEEQGWEQPGTFYVHVGTKDSRGSSVPAGATALVEPIAGSEKKLPNPRSIYLLQFGNGYRCSHCVASNGRLRLFSTGKTYLGREDFAYPGSVRIVGRIRMFAMSLPAPEYTAPIYRLPGGADLILPWEHRTRDRLFLTKHRRFRRSKAGEAFVHEFLNERLQVRLSGRSERRYRRPTPSDPHVNGLIHLALAHMARYSDALRTGGSWHSDRARFSLESILHAHSLEEVLASQGSVALPTPRDVWEARREEFGGWPPLLSIGFPNLRQWEDRIVRLAEGSDLAGLDPTLGPGSLLLLEHISSLPDSQFEGTKSGWSRPIYVLRRGLQIICGHLERNGSDCAISGAHGQIKASFRPDDLASLSQVAGVAVPV